MKGHVIFKVPSLATNKSNCPDWRILNNLTIHYSWEWKYKKIYLKKIYWWLKNRTIFTILIFYISELSDCSKLDEGFDGTSCSECETGSQQSASKNVKTMTLNISFLNTSPLASGFSLVTPGYSRDKELTSGLASSPMSSTPEECPSTSSNITKSSSLCKSGHLPSMYADSTSDSDYEFSPSKYSNKRRSATSHMTLRRNRKRRQGGNCCALVLHQNLRQNNQWLSYKNRNRAT